MKQESKQHILSEEDQKYINLLNSQDLDFKEEMKSLTGHEFEQVIANLYEQMGYNAEVTSGSGEQGADVIARNSFEKLAIQTKHYKGKVSNSAIQEIVAALKYYDADRALVITTSSFTSSAQDLAKSNEVKIHGRDWLKSKVKRFPNVFEL